ncbi:hypothetical protein WS64_04725 [Burkholderia anthina]|uniref:Secreted protein n=1 Tax=Burkholderia anthina TaxID=179879 RepID=A0AAW3Q0I8_9BURK|nr:hypothetical protein WS64_04725 [Burkholderia anthina]
MQSMANQHETGRIQRVSAVLVILFRILAVEPVCNDFAVGDRAEAFVLLQLDGCVLVKVDASVPHTVCAEWVKPVLRRR